jgi:hypothetical protein
LFCHIFDATLSAGDKHTHIFDCDAPPSAFLHLLQHLQKNDNNILELLSCENNDLFLRCFKENLNKLIQVRFCDFEERKAKNLPLNYYINYISSTFVETTRWWISNGMKEKVETIYSYFLSVI